MSKLPALPDRTVCHQYEIRENHRERADNQPPFLMSDLKQAVIRKVDFQTAKPIIVDHEWLGRMSATSVHGDIRHLEMYWLQLHFVEKVHGDIRHLENANTTVINMVRVHGDIRHLEM